MWVVLEWILVVFLVLAIIGVLFAVCFAFKPWSNGFFAMIVALVVVGGLAKEEFLRIQGPAWLNATLDPDRGPTWTFTTRLGFTVATIPPDAERELWLTREEFEVQFWGTNAPSFAGHQLHTVQSLWVNVRLPDGEAYSVEQEIKLGDLGYDAGVAQILAEYGALPPHNFDGPTARYTRAPPSPLFEALTVGSAVDAHWKDTWYPATVLAIDPIKGFHIHYTDFEAKWDEWVYPHRIRLKTPPGAADPAAQP